MTKDEFFCKFKESMATHIDEWEAMNKEPELRPDNEIVSIYKKKGNKRMRFIITTASCLS